MNYIDKKVNEAPQFYTLFAFIMITAVVIILIPNAPLIPITIGSQIINAILLPVVLISMIRMVNNKEVMGEYVNNRFQNAVGWITTVVLITLTILNKPVNDPILRMDLLSWFRSF